MQPSTPPTICIVLSEHLANEYTGPLARGAVAAASAFGCRLVLYSPLVISLTRRVIPLSNLPLLPPGADGYLTTPYVTDDVTAYCRRRGATVLTFAGTRPGLPAIVPDNYGGAREATAHLIAHGRRRIVHLAGVADSQEAADRHAGYRAALQDAGLAYDPALVAPGEFQVLPAEESIARLLHEGTPFDAVFAANDLGARGAINALTRVGLRVPHDVAVIGFDDSTPASTLDPPLTSVRQSAFQIGWDAVRLLIDAHAGTPPPLHTRVPTQLVIRESCGCAPGQAAHQSWPEGMAALFGGSQGPLVNPDDVIAWAEPLERSLAGDADPAGALEAAIGRADAQGWHVPAIGAFLADWRQRRTSSGHDPSHAALRSADAMQRLSEQIDRAQQRRRIARARRVNAATYVIDLLHEYGDGDALAAELRYIISSGPREALSVQRSARPGSVVAQHVVAGADPALWEGPAEDFPPPAWLAAGEVLLLMPMAAAAQQQVLLGVIERAEREHLDLDDMLLRAINTYRSITVLNETLRELDAARSVQQSLLPRHAPHSEDYDIAGATRPARHVGGDLYGYYVRPSGALALALGDVSGKGMPAALLMSACATALAGTIPAGLAPSLTLSQIHQLLHPSVGNTQNAAICLAYLDGPRVRLANAGAIAPMICTADQVRQVDVGGLPLGTALSDIRPYIEVELRLLPGELLILSSDGIVEAMNERREMYGFERFVASIARGPRESAQAMLAHLFADVAAFTHEAEVHDDMAIVVARYLGGA